MLIARRLAAIGGIACAAAMIWACGARVTAQDVPASPPVAPIRPEANAPSCDLLAEPGDPVTTVAIDESVDPSHAPYPVNDSERLVFRQLYETLVRVDCNGRVVAGLAASWRPDENGRTWVVTLRENARFADGTALTAHDVRVGWTSDGIELRPQVRRLVQSVAALDERNLIVTVRSAHAETPIALAHTDLAVARSVSGSPWPIGTRSASVTPDPDARNTTAGAPIVVNRMPGPSIRFVPPRRDPRDLLDQGVDLLLTRDSATIGYAATLSQFQSLPMPWQRTRVLLTPGRVRTAPLLTDEARQTLAADSVRGEARGAMGPFWWQMLADCEVVRLEPGGPRAPIPRIVYDGSDAAARDLAERFVGLVRASGPAPILDAILPDRPRRTFQRAAGLTGEGLALARRLGNDAGYVVSIERQPLEPCRELQVLMSGGRWLDPETIVPLVETRLRAIVRRGRSGVTTEWDGGLLLAAGRDVPAAR